ncbi:Biopolymer transporter ExbD [Planctomycetales bacterium 10988]|nr:Biopolymer transporter ExbD [Planctomycetales bacterium 10988]
MRAPTSFRSEQRSLELKMTPLIDVVFLLLIFFVCTTSFQPPEEMLPTQLMTAGSQAVLESLDIPEDAHEPIVIKLHTGPELPAWEVQGQGVQELCRLREMLAGLGSIRADLPIVLDADGNVPLGNVVEVYDLCRLVGFSQIQFAADIQEE